MVVAAIIHLLGFVLQAIGGDVRSYGLFVTTFALIGFGSGIQDANANGWVAGLPNAANKLGYIHAAYGLGALLSPLAATGFVTSGADWYLLYTVSAAIATINVAFLLYAFRLRPAITDPDAHQSATLVEILRTPLCLLFCAFYLVYVGLEVTVGGWTVSYLIDVRGAPTSAGYVSSGFFGGLTLGRLILIPVTKRLGERSAIYVYSTLGIAFSLITWLVPSFIPAAISVSFLGLVLGPAYPVGISVATKLLPRKAHTAAVGTFAVCGQAGSALLPFATGALAQRYGVSVLQPVCLALLIAMVALWSLIPAVSRRSE